MCNVLEAIAETVGEVVGGVNLPLVLGSVVLLLEDSVSCEIPHLRVAALDVLLHSKEGGLRLVFAIAHISKLLKVGLDVLLGVLASISRSTCSLLSTTLELDLSLITVTDVGFSQVDELLGEVVELLEVVAGVSHSAGSETCAAASATSPRPLSLLQPPSYLATEQFLQSQ